MSLQEKLFNALIIGYSLIILLLDYISPVGIATGSLYIIVIVASSFLVSSKRELYIITLICSVLIILGYFLSVPVSFEAGAIFNRAISLFIVFVGCSLGAAFMTHRKKEKALDKQFRIAMEAAPNAMVMVDASGKIIFTNKQMQSLFGYDEKELLENNIDFLVPDSFRIHHKDYRNQFLDDPKPRAMGTGRDLFGLKKDGSQVPIEIGLTPIKSEHGLFIVSAIVDLTERQKTEKQLLALNTKLSDKNIELEQFVYTVSHDLKAPLVSISGFSRKLKQFDILQQNEKTARYIDRIIFNIDKMEGLIQDLLSLSRISHRALDIEEIDLNNVIKHCIDVMQTQIQTSKASIIVSDILPIVQGQGNLLEQIFSNLISNAIKYCQDNRAPEIHIGLHSKTDSEFTVYVKDNGMGIDEEHYSKIFEIFERLDPEKCEGSGVGLAIVKKIIEKHSGNIWVESHLDEGTCFYITMPFSMSVIDDDHQLARET